MHKTMIDIEYIWVFNASNSGFPGGIFKELEIAEMWIKSNKLSGTLTRYPIDIGVLDWAIQNQLFNISKPNNKAKSIEPKFIGTFTSASQEHFHYENGNK